MDELTPPSRARVGREADQTIPSTDIIKVLGEHIERTAARRRQWRVLMRVAIMVLAAAVTALGTVMWFR